MEGEHISLSINYKMIVRCFTYNQSKYIEETLNGFAIQKTNFPYICLIVDDASTDNEQNVIVSWLDKNCQANSKKITKTEQATIIIATSNFNALCTFVVYLLNENLYRRKKEKLSLIAPWQQKSQYEAICEGDDYWTNPDKLQKQFDFLESHLDYGMCYGIAKQYNDKEKKFSFNRGEEYYSFEKLLLRNPIPTLTTCYRTKMFLEIMQEEWIQNAHWPLGDLPMWLWMAYRTKLYFFPEVFGVYRILETSAAHNKSIESQIAFYKAARTCANEFSRRYLNRELPPFEEHHERARLYSRKIHNRKKAFEEYKKIPNKNLKYWILTIVHSNIVTYKISSLYYRLRYQQ